MKETEFIDQIKRQTLELKKFKGKLLPKSFIEISINSLSIRESNNISNKSVTHNLITNYYFPSDFQIMGIWLNKSIKEDNNLVYFGKLDADDLIEDKSSGEIKLLESGEQHVLSVCSESIESFLDVLAYLNKCYISNILNDKIGYSKNEVATMKNTATSLAGGRAYHKFYSWFLDFIDQRF